MRSKILIVGVNWLGDSIMSMPAIEAFRAENPDAEITIAVKQKLVELWGLVPAVQDILVINEGADGTVKTSRAIKERCFDRAYVFPNSFRSALLPFMASVPRRIGMAGHVRRAMLNEVTEPVSEAAGRLHQVWEYADILGVKPRDFPWLPQISLPADARERARTLVKGLPDRIVAMIPGAAFGDLKRWPAEHFCEVGSRAVREHGVGIVVLGSSSEMEICSAIATRIGSNAVSAAGRTNLTEMAALLKVCRYAVSNDCGGMHVAAAMGVKTVAIFGITDPSKTGPIGEGHRLVCAEGVRGSRDIGKGASEAKARLASISPDRVYKELNVLLTGMDGNG